VGGNAGGSSSESENSEPKPELKDLVLDVQKIDEDRQRSFKN
jgi:hypothetical protein